MNNDPQLTQEVTKKLEGYPKLDASHLRVVASKAGYVTLSGYVRHFAEKVDAISIAKSVKGVQSVLDDIEVVPPGQEVPKGRDTAYDFGDGSDGGAESSGE